MSDKRRIRALVVEDSPTIRAFLVQTLESDPELEIVGEAGDGQLGFELCEQLRPDVVVLDILMPVVDGVECTRRIMSACPTPILVVTANAVRGELWSGYDALVAGAVDMLVKPSGDDHAQWTREFVAATKLVSRIRVVRRFARAAPSAPVAAAPRRAATEPYGLVAIGASTGGPSAVVQIVSSLPADFPLPILLVLHTPREFAVPLADWLGQHSTLPVVQAEDGQNPFAPERPRVYVACADRHLVMRGGRLALSDAPERNFCRPSVDVLFESLAVEAGERVIACLLTGMGKDGAMGLLAVRRAGGMTLAQDEETSVVWGMPGEAARLGAATRVLPLGEVAPTLLTMTRLPSFTKGERR